MHLWPIWFSNFSTKLLLVVFKIIRSHSSVSDTSITVRQVAVCCFNWKGLVQDYFMCKDTFDYSFVGVLY